jgi:hypothetical protein
VLIGFYGVSPKNGAPAIGKCTASAIYLLRPARSGRSGACAYHQPARGRPTVLLDFEYAIHANRPLPAPVAGSLKGANARADVARAERRRRK